MNRFIPYRREFLPFAEAIFDSNVPEFVDQAEKTDLFRFLEMKEEGLYYYIFFVENEPAGMCGYFFQPERNEAVLCWGLLHRKFHRMKLGTEMLRFRIGEIRKIAPSAKIICRTSQVTEGFFAKAGFITIEEADDYWARGLHLRKMILE